MKKNSIKYYLLLVGAIVSMGLIMATVSLGHSPVTSALAGDTEAPSGGTVKGPTGGVSPGTAFYITGVARDTSNSPMTNASVKSVRVAVLNQITGKWMQDNSPLAWGDTRVALDATFTQDTQLSGGTATRKWQYSLPLGLPGGTYRFEAQTRDDANNAEKPVVQTTYTVGRNDTIVPSGGTITSPLDFTAWIATNTQTITGVAKDRSNGDSSSPSVSNIDKVKITIRDRDTDQYLQSDGVSFGPERNVFFANLGSFSYNSGTWTQNWSWTPSPKLPTGEYTVAAIAQDLAGNTEDSLANPEAEFAVGTATGTSYLTLLLGRAQMQQFGDSTCSTSITSPTGSLLTLTQVASRLKSRTRPLAAVGSVTPNRTNESLQRLCVSGISYPNWSDLNSLRDNFGWKFISTGQAYTDLSSATFPYVDHDPNPDVIVPSLNAEICGSLNAFSSHGHNSASGLFAFPDNNFPAGTPNASSSCFSFGRNYQFGFNVRTKAAYPWLAKASSINGGYCNISTLSCYKNVPGDSPSTKRYEDPNVVARLMTSRAGLWSIVQTYRFVTGSKTSGVGPNWSCTDSDWKKHWTSQTELYCWNDYESALNSIPGGTIVTDPKTVGDSWGRSL